MRVFEVKISDNVYKIKFDDTKQNMPYSIYAKYGKTEDIDKVKLIRIAHQLRNKIVKEKS